jgi:hypothetical protein
MIVTKKKLFWNNGDKNMVRTESLCCGCQGMPCMGSACPNYEITVFKCDDCGVTQEDLYYYDGEELCIDCIIKRLKVLEYEEGEETICDGCNNEGEVYEYDGQQFCYDCLRDYLKKDLERVER